jgi:hypothetical protein
VATLWRRLHALAPADRRLLAETVLVMLRVRAGLLVLGYPALRRRLDRSRPSRHPSPQTSDRVAWAVAAVARRLPGTTCLVQSLAAYALLRRRGHSPELHIGVRGRGGDTAMPLDAHAWVECEGRVVAGELDDLAEYGRLDPVRPPVSPTPDQS